MKIHKNIIGADVKIFGDINVHGHECIRALCN